MFWRPKHRDARIEIRLTPAEQWSVAESAHRAGRRARTAFRPALTAAAEPDEAEALGLPAGAKVLRIGRTYFLGRAAVGAATSVLPAHLVPELAGRLPAGTSLHRALAEHCGREPEHVRSLVRLPVPTTGPAPVAGLPPNAPLARTLSLYRDRSTGRPLELLDRWMRLDHFDLVTGTG
ncbi:UTRA domain-containing protein [Kitasatospora cineracea]|uniref:UTRA domain-containing protein n=1 Tax=Kitasatospora cineracea TaxID=88074 RepID=UPI0013C2D6F3|nr:UTRA domain-containing protein [Kitasatospora cineracea]